MKQLLEFIPLVLFFITYKMFGVRDAAIVLVIATIVQMIVLKLKYGVIEKQQKIMAIAVIFFGLLTAYFNEIKYLQWKVIKQRIAQAVSQASPGGTIGDVRDYHHALDGCGKHNSAWLTAPRP